MRDQQRHIKINAKVLSVGYLEKALVINFPLEFNGIITKSYLFNSLYFLLLGFKCIWYGFV